MNNLQQIEEMKTETSNEFSTADIIYRQRIKELYGDSYTIIGTYINSRQKIKVRHNSINCNNYEWEAFPRNLLQGHGCPKCSGRVKMTEDEFKSVLGEEYRLLSEYKGITIQVYLEHCNPDIHNENCKFYVTPKQFKQGIKCPECERLKETERLRKEITDVSNGEYSLTGEFYGKTEKIRIRHNSKKCNNHEWNIRIYNFFAGHGCPKCNKSGSKSLQNSKKDAT